MLDWKVGVIGLSDIGIEDGIKGIVFMGWLLKDERVEGGWFIVLRDWDDLVEKVECVDGDWWFIWFVVVWGNVEFLLNEDWLFEFGILVWGCFFVWIDYCKKLN